MTSSSPTVSPWTACQRVHSPRRTAHKRGGRELGHELVGEHEARERNARHKAAEHGRDRELVAAVSYRWDSRSLPVELALGDERGNVDPVRVGAGDGLEGLGGDGLICCQSKRTVDARCDAADECRRLSSAVAWRTMSSTGSVASRMDWGELCDASAAHLLEVGLGLELGDGGGECLLDRRCGGHCGCCGQGQCLG